MTVSVVIPTRDAGPGFEAVLEAVGAQAGVGEVEVVVVDSGSRDGTVDRARRFGAEVVEIEPGDFDHGRTRNLGIGHARGECVALLSQDARPRDAHWLAPLVEAVRAPGVAGAYSRVLPRPDASPLEARWAREDLVHGEQRRVKCVSSEAEWRALTPAECRERAHFNNVSSCVRKGVIESLPFPARGFGEDLAWGIAALAAGWSLVYEPRSVVVHSYAPGLARDFRRHRADARLLRELLGLRTRPSLARAVGGAARAVGADFVELAGRPVGERIRWGAYSPLLRGAQTLGQWVGSRDRDR